MKNYMNKIAKQINNRVFFEGLLSFVFTVAIIKSIFKNEVLNSLPLIYLFLVLYFIMFVITNYAYSFISKIFSRNGWRELIIIILILLISTPAIFTDSNVQDRIENRNLAIFPKNYSHKDFQKSFENWLNDHFLFRANYINMNYSIVKFFESNRIENEKAFSGKNGWLFSKRNGFSLEMDKVTLFTENELLQMKNNIEKTKLWLNNRGIAFYLFIPPMKDSVYHEYYPNYVNRTENKTKLEQLLEYMKKNSQVEIICPYEELVKHKKENLEYIKKDTHWNTLGAFYGYNMLANRIKKDFKDINILSLEDFNIEEKETNIKDFDLAKMLRLNGTEKVPTLVPKKDLSYSLSYGDYDSMKQSKGLGTCNKNGKYDVLMYRDSFTINMMQGFSETFRNVDYNWTGIFGNVQDKIEKNKPDIVVQEVMEIYLEYLLASFPKAEVK